MVRSFFDACSTSQTGWIVFIACARHPTTFPSSTSFRDAIGLSLLSVSVIKCHRSCASWKLHRSLQADRLDFPSQRFRCRCHLQNVHHLENIALSEIWMIEFDEVQSSTIQNNFPKSHPAIAAKFDIFSAAPSFVRMRALQGCQYWNDQSQLDAAEEAKHQCKIHHRPCRHVYHALNPPIQSAFSPAIVVSRQEDPPLAKDSHPGIEALASFRVELFSQQELIASAQ